MSGDGGRQLDVLTGRSLIEGRRVLIDGEVFVSRDGTRTIVDASFDRQPKLNECVEGIVQKMRVVPSIALRIVVDEARKAMPVNDEHVESVRKNWPKVDSYPLHLFFSQKREGDGQEIGGGSADHQALLVGLTIERYYKEVYPITSWKGASRRLFGTMPKVAILKDPKDGHAVVSFMNSDDSVYMFDPKKEGLGFTKL